MSDAEKQVPPPYGPTGGMLAGIELMHRLSPAKVDARLLKNNSVAPGNEYKVVGALRYLGIIDEDGKPTTKSRLLKTRGPSYVLALQDIVKTAYTDIFDEIDIKQASRDQIHNCFITELGLGIEMATKASRFFISLCQQANIQINPALVSSKEPGAANRLKQDRIPRKRRTEKTSPEGAPLDPSPTFALSITPETADMSLEELIVLFRKIRLAIRRSQIDE
ncbi:MAG: DUF5343 domain-containing protein [Chloroflexi bacterium]|jgi:hypothetical protein|nr:DUF5343 domain-containing protein [Chloroflexota bacterium]MBT7080730.1 DUF5343 domain-containing protein [Chloroflexota bacterium]MBT7290873.1 DUF5343 domain-containing protein [Chloroflexota bacterium]